MNSGEKMVINLSGPDGKAINLVNIGHKIANKNRLNWTKISKEMMRGDYNHLLQVFENYFGNHVTLSK